MVGEPRLTDVLFQGMTGRKGSCLEMISPGVCLNLTGKSCKLTETSWQNTLSGSKSLPSLGDSLEVQFAHTPFITTLEATVSLLCL